MLGEYLAHSASIENVTDCVPIPVLRHEFILVLQVSVSIVCILSVLGASLIILTYVAFKNLRTVARELLVHLSIADICVAMSHLVGITALFPKYVANPCDWGKTPIDINVTELACKIQGGVAVFGAVSSFFWSVAVAIYLLVLIVFEKPKLGKYLRYFFYVICWGAPTVLVIVFGFNNYLGFDEGVDVGWCYVRWVHDSHNISNTQRWPQVLGYQVWVYATYIALPLIYIWIRCYVRVKLSRVHNHLRVSEKLQSKARLADLKLTFVPLIFVLLRIWGTILSIPLIYLDFKKRLDFRTTSVNAVLVFLSGVGSSSQGLMNAILFCVFTSVVRKKLTKATVKIFCFFCQTRTLKMSQEPSTSSEESMEETTQYGDSNAREDGEEDEHTMQQALLSSNCSIQHYSSVTKRLPDGTE